MGVTTPTKATAEQHQPGKPAPLAPGSDLDRQIRVLLGFFIRFSTARRRDHVQLPGSPNDFARLTTPHLSAAAQLFLHGPLTVGELAEQLAVTYATASLVATDLERAGAIERERDPADGRRVVLRLHPTIGAKAMNHRIEPMRRTLQRLDAAERKTFVKAMSIFIEELEGR